jgi:hypothetical protein
VLLDGGQDPGCHRLDVIALAGQQQARANAAPSATTLAAKRDSRPPEEEE